MSARALSVILLAVVCGVSAAVGMTRLRDTEFIKSDPKTTQIVVAKLEIARGTQLQESMLETRDWPTDLIPPRSLVRIDDAIERSAMSPMVPGEPVLDTKLSPRDAGRGLASLVPSGMRAYTVLTQRLASNVAGFVLPGNRVDVLLTLRGNSNDGTGGGSTTTLLQAVEILAVDQRLEAPAENRVDPKELHSVTLLVTPDHAALLDLGQNLGNLTLSLRNPEDLTEADTRPATLDQIRFAQRPPNTEQKEGRQSAWAQGLSRFGTALAAVATAPLPAKPDEEKAIAAKAEAEEPEEEAPEDRIFEIRTLRGRHSGRVYVEGPDGPPERDVAAR